MELEGEHVEEGLVARGSSECVGGYVEELEEEDCSWLDFARDELVEKEVREAVTENGEGFLKEARSEDAEADMFETTSPNCRLEDEAP